MKFQVYIITDKVTSQSSLPMFAVNNQEAKRCVKHACLTPGTDAHTFASDHDLSLIGIYDDSLGLITGHALPEHVCSISDLLKEE